MAWCDGVGCHQSWHGVMVCVCVSSIMAWCDGVGRDGMVWCGDGVGHDGVVWCGVVSLCVVSDVMARCNGVGFDVVLHVVLLCGV